MSIFAPLGNTNVTRGQGIQNDVFTSNVTVNCDPRLVVPETDANIRNGLVKPEIAGKIAVEHDLCDLDVRNLTIHGNYFWLCHRCCRWSSLLPTDGEKHQCTHSSSDWTIRQCVMR